MFNAAASKLGQHKLVKTRLLDLHKAASHCCESELRATIASMDNVAAVGPKTSPPCQDCAIGKMTQQHMERSETQHDLGELSEGGFEFDPLREPNTGLTDNLLRPTSELMPKGWAVLL